MDHLYLSSVQEDFENRVVPRILLPFHVIDYSEEEIIELVESKNLVKKRKLEHFKNQLPRHRRRPFLRLE